MPEETTTKELEGSCDGCGAPGLYYPNRDDYYCPRCAAYHDLNDAAEEHLGELLTPIYQAWEEHWTARGLPRREMDDTMVLVAENHKEK